MNEKTEIDKEYIDYYWLRKDLYSKSKHLKFGYGQLPSGFTEGICNEIYKMKTMKYTKENKDKGADSEDKDGNLVEIKCTQEKGSSVTINRSEDYKYLLWINFDYENDTIRIKKFNKKDVDEVIQKASSKNDRVTINLNSIKNIILEESFKFNKLHLEKS